MFLTFGVICDIEGDPYGKCCFTKETLIDRITTMDCVALSFSISKLLLEGS